MSSNEKSAIPSFQKVVQFENYEYNFYLNSLSKHGKTIELQNKPAEILAILLSVPGKLVTREDIIEKVWGSQIVDFDQSINFCIKCIRKALDDDPRHASFIQTIPRKGYRFIAKIEPVGMTNSITKSPKLYNRFSGLYLSIVLFIAMILIVVFFTQMAIHKPSVIEMSDTNSQELKRAQFLLDKSNQQSVTKSAEIFKRITSLNNDSADAYAGLAIATFLVAEPVEAKSVTIEYAQQAYNIDSRNSGSNLAMGMVELYFNWNIPQARQYLIMATKLDPQSIRAWHELSVIQTIQQDYKAAHRSIEQALAIDPGRVQELFHSGWFYMVSGNYNRALEQCLKSIEINPTHTYSHLCVIDAANELNLHQTAYQHMLAYMKLLDAPEAALQQISGTADEDQAQAFYEFRLQALKDYGVDEYRMAIGFAQTGEADLAMASLQKAINNSNFMIPCAWADYGFKSLRQLPNFTNMMAAAVIR